MHSWITPIRNFFHGPGLSGNAGRTFRLHLAYAVLDATAGGILLIAPVVAIKALAAPNWQLQLRELYAGLGMVASLYLGSRMATQSKIPFVFIPGVLAATCSLSMAAATGSAFWFLTLLGAGAMFEIVTRPAITAVLRSNYPVDHRGYATGEIRKWSSLAFMASSIGAAVLLQGTAGSAGATRGTTARALETSSWPWSAQDAIQFLIVLAGLLSLASFACFRQIRVEEDLDEHRSADRPKSSGGLGDALRLLVARDGRFRRYLCGCFVDGFSQMLYYPLIWAFFRDLRFDYLGCTLLMHTIPALAAFAATGALGRFLDRSNPWTSWALIRFAWGLDALLLAAAPLAAAWFPHALLILPVLGRVLRGSVQGGWWIMWWQVGVTYFAPPGEDTSRYMGVMVFLNGTTRLLASAAGMALAAASVPPSALLVLGGAGVILSGAFSLWQATWERRQHGPETMTEFEHQFDFVREARAGITDERPASVS
jgi:hypothetical protein